jgi:RNase H-fold protein (predicted Holliday junction resolvase)
MTILAIDPGTAKCGVAVVRREGEHIEILHHEVAQVADVVSRAEVLLKEYDLHSIIVGNATQGKAILRSLRAVLPEDTCIGLVREDHTTEEARERYWQEHPRHGWQRLIPRSLCTPPCPYDDYAAVVLAEHYLQASSLK